MKFCLVALCFLLGCVKEIEIPKEVMTKNQMISLLIDIHILEAQTGQIAIPKDSSRALFKYFEGDILKENGIDDSLYYKSLVFYYDNPQLMEQIYEAVVDSLSLYERMSKGNTEGSVEQPNN